MSTLFLTCGLPASGKTTVAKTLEREHAAVRLTADEWLQRIHPDLSSAQLDQLRPGVEHLQEELAGRLLSLGVNVILDWGLWAREERDHFRALARRLGAKVVLLVTEPDLEKIRQRIADRNAAFVPGDFQIAEADLERALRFWQSPTSDELALFDPVA